MKNILIILSLAFSLNFYAQDPLLFENTWYLHNVIINGQNNPPPFNSEVLFVPLNFYKNGSDDFITTVCNSFSGTLIYVSNQNFTIQDYLLTLILCDLEENIIFEGIYLSFFFDSTSQDPYKEPFSYTIVVKGNEKTLTVENVNGDEAIYGNEILSNENFEVSQFSIYPNPVIRELFLYSEGEAENLKIKIFNIEGKLLSSQSLEFEKQASIDVSVLSNGMYFLNIENENGNSTIKKFVKN